MTYIDQITDYALNLQYDDIPPEAVQLAKWIVFDTLGTGLGGFQRDLGQKAVRFGAEMYPGDAATIIGSGERSTMEGAAFANGVMVKILGMDDSHRSAGHIASQLIPAVLAVAEAYETTGKDVITAIVAAYDFAVRVGLQVRHAQRARGLDLKGTVGPMASALGAARCAGLSAAQTRHAIGMAADMASGTEQYVYEGGLCDTKDLIAGFGARSGVFAMRLAEGGFYGPSEALEGEYGFFRAFGEGTHDPAWLDDLGEHFAITTTAFKPHGGCRHTHQAVDAVQQLLSEAPLDTTTIDRVCIETYGYATRPIFRVDPNPPSRDVAGLSIRVATAVALVRGSAWPQDYAYWDDPEVRRLRQITDVEVEPDIEAGYPASNGCRLQLKLSTGEDRSVYVPNMKGEPEFRMTATELVDKFCALTRDLFDEAHAESIYERCEELENAANIGAIIDMTVPKPV